LNLKPETMEKIMILGLALWMGLMISDGSVINNQGTHPHPAIGPNDIDMSNPSNVKAYSGQMSADKPEAPHVHPFSGAMSPDKPGTSHAHAYTGMMTPD
jgi:hypothetical protein